ncbi:hypothetical protein TRFO_05511 [Tritrichomonas foetus]|uniref:Myb-like DNA-binding domain containing protein n=1 Tax=Tritrichomonas foetus TaxID=1144522 RepID=A0A1J4KA61_9EUKA|nr:hypothetical protein TRFO_05511 [Tritrichomonas foetus]|eukprot:OHT06341.1 hypothetical protein TRFO_05511 [Tritrichomonas foetus]
MKTGCSRKQFSEEEDKLLKKLVKEHGDCRWDFIAASIPFRSGRQCRDRYRNYLAPNLKLEKWTQEEDELLVQKYNELGPKWSKISKFFSGRTGSSLKNRWNYSICPRNKKKNATAVLNEVKDNTEVNEFITDRNDPAEKCEKHHSNATNNANSQFGKKENEKIHEYEIHKYRCISTESEQKESSCIGKIYEHTSTLNSSFSQNDESFDRKKQKEGENWCDTIISSPENNENMVSPYQNTNIKDFNVSPVQIVFKERPAFNCQIYFPFYTEPIFFDGSECICEMGLRNSPDANYIYF